MPRQKFEFGLPAPRRSRGSEASADRDPPAEQALARLLEAELAEAQSAAPDVIAQCDPGRVWLLWFAIGATEEISRVIQRRANDDRDRMFRHVVATIFGDGFSSQASPMRSPPRLIQLFETAGAEAVRACMRGETTLGYYLAALKNAWGCLAEPMPDRVD